MRTLIERGWAKLRFLANKWLYLCNGFEIGPRLLLITNRNSYTGSQLASNSMTLDDLERQNRGFYGFFRNLGCNTSLYHSQGVATELSLCDPDREFGICILT